MNHYAMTAENEKVCGRCGRVIQRNQWFLHDDIKQSCTTPVGVYYVHDSYGCDTGCCGHAFYVEDDLGRDHNIAFDFGHERDELDEKAAQIAADHGCIVLTDRCGFFSE